MMAVLDKVVPLVILLSWALHIACVATRAWVYVYRGALIVATLSPWYLCASDKECTASTCSEQPRLNCFWMTEWPISGLGLLTVAQHVEYWALGSAVLSLLPAFLNCCDPNQKWCEMEARRPAIILIAITACFSLIAFLFYVAGLQTDNTIYNLTSDHLAQGFIFYLRVIVCLLHFTSLIMAVIQLIKQSRRRSREDFMDTVTFVPLSREEEDQVVFVDHGMRL